MAGKGLLLGAFAGEELIYSFIILVLCFFIYYETREIYKLSSHKGIKYFRKIFLFIGLAYLFKFLSKLFMFGSVRISYEAVFLILIATMYSSLIAGVYLISAISTRMQSDNYSKFFLVFHILAILISLISVLMAFPLVYILSQIIILIIGGVFLFKKRDLKKSFIYVVYPLILFFLVVSLLDLFIPEILFFWQILIYFISILLFITILYKIIKRVYIK